MTRTLVIFIKISRFEGLRTVFNVSKMDRTVHFYCLKHSTTWSTTVVGAVKNEPSGAHYLHFLCRDFFFVCVCVLVAVTDAVRSSARITRGCITW